MKRKYILLALLVLVGISCSDHDLEGGTFIQKEQVQVTADIAKSRVGFKDADSIVYAFWQNGDTITLSTPTQGYMNYTAAVSSENSTTVVFSPQDIALKDVDAETVYACYPGDTIIDGMVELPATDVWTDTEPLPFAYAVSSIQESKVSLSFQHTYAFLKLTLSDKQLENVVSTDGEKSIHRVLVKSSSDFLGLLSGHFNFEDRSISIAHGTNEIELRLSTPFNPTEETERNVYIPILPIEEGVMINISLIHDHEGGQDVLVEMNKETPENGFMAGNVYSTNVETVKEMAYLCQGGLFNNYIKQLANGHSVSSNMTDSIIKRIEFKVEHNTLPEDYINVSNGYSPEPIYASFNLTDSLLTIFTPAKSIGIFDASWAFAQLKGLSSIDFANFSVDETTANLKCMFVGCSSLTTLDISNWDTSNVTDMSAMFRDCSSLSTLDVSTWNVSNVSDVNQMFYGCSSLSTLDVSTWNTSNMTDMSYMFVGCSSLTTLDVSTWNTSNMTDMSGVFGGCSSLTTLDLSAWNTSNVSDMGQMFNGCSSLTTLDLSTWNTSNISDMGEMFYDCSSLSTLDVSNWDTSNVTNLNDMFVQCSSLITLDVSNWDTSNATDMSRMFWGCSSLSTLDVSTWNVSNVVSMRYTFGSCSSLTALDVSNWNTSNVSDMVCMFQDCSSLATLDVSAWNTSNVTVMGGMFRDCSSLSTLDVSAWNTSNVSDMGQMFNGCRALTTLDVSNWNTSNVTNMSTMFYYCDALTFVDTSQWNTSNVTNMYGMFFYCHSLTTLDTSNWDTSKVTDMCRMFYQCYDLFRLNTSQWNTINVTDMSFMFSLCSIENLDASNWDTSNVTNMSDMFSGCQNLAKLDMSKWIFKDETLVDDMFQTCGSYKNGFEITCTKITQDFLLDKVNTDIVSWVIVE